MRRESSTRAAGSACLRVCRRGPLFSLAIGLSLVAVALPASAARRCYSPGTATRHLHHKVCVKAHVYREISLDDGTRILDICSPRTGSDRCRFAFVSLNSNREKVGSLKKYVGREIEVRGKIRPVHGKAEILLTRARQVHVVQRSELARKKDTPVRRSRFHPNPQLLKSFNATRGRMPIADPAFRGGYRN